MRSGKTTPRHGAIEHTIRSLYARLRAAREASPERQWALAMPLARALVCIDFLDEAMAILERLNACAPAPRSNPAGWFGMRLLMARHHRLRHRLDQAADELSALAACDELHQHKRLAFEVHDELVRTRLAQGRMREAAHALQDAKAVAAGLRQPWLRGTCELHQAHIERADHRLPQAMSCIARALPLIRKAGCIASEAQAVWLLGKCRALQGQVLEAAQNRRLSLQLQRQHRRSLSRQQDAVRRLVFSNAVDPLAISEREMACLRWCAQGKTAWETGQIMALSEWTVVYHLERVKRKLGVRRKREAVAQAIGMGLIEPVMELPRRARTSRPSDPAQHGRSSS